MNYRIHEEGLSNSFYIRSYYDSAKTDNDYFVEEKAVSSALDCLVIRKIKNKKELSHGDKREIAKIIEKYFGPVLWSQSDFIL